MLLVPGGVVGHRWRASTGRPELEHKELDRPEGSGQHAQRLTGGLTVDAEPKQSEH